MSERTDSAEPCSLLSWDTEFWGFPIARLHATRVDAEVMRVALDWCSRHGVRCLYLLADGGCPRTLALAHEHAFRFVDIRLELSLPLPAAPPAVLSSAGPHVRAAAAADIPLLRSLAAAAHHDTRFFKDDRFEAFRAAALYEAWITRDMRRGSVLVCDSPSEPGTACGYVTCELDGTSREGRIGLIAVAPQHKNAGLGSALITAALGKFAAAGMTSSRVVTQGTNIPALRLYERCGFRTTSARVWFHRWF
jgi:dTDP-4-amino-4,6-dideoxy-D-galactose acyltransferase